MKVVFMTNGDGYPKGVEIEDQISHPTAKDYRVYGEERHQEALKALTNLGLKAQNVVALGFPDGGLCELLWKFRADPQAYTSPFTQERRPPTSEMISPHTDYNAHDLEAEIERLLSRFEPNLVAVTPPEDEHPDHCSSYYFVRKAISDVGRKLSSFKPILLTFLVHFKQWPFDQGADLGTRMSPPQDFPDKQARWMELSLTPQEADTKRQTILAYHSQMLVIGPFMLSFSRTNELFRMEHRTLSKEMENMPCCRK